jgi:hypothetical protein
MAVTTLWYPDGNQHYIGRIMDRLFVSNIHTARALAQINPFGIRFVVNATMWPVDLPPDIQVIKLDLKDDAAIPKEVLYATLGWMHEMIKYDPVLVNCWAGRSRSAAIVAAYLCRCGMDWEEAERFIKDKWVKTNIHPLVAASVREAVNEMATAAI